MADLIPHLILAGHTAGRAGHALATRPGWARLGRPPPGIITSYAAASARCRARGSRLPADPPGVPNPRPVRPSASNPGLVNISP